MGLLQKIIQRIRRRLLLPGENFGDKKHGECSRFNSGVYVVAPRILNLTNLNPKGQACPHFKAIKIIKNKPKTKKILV